MSWEVQTMRSKTSCFSRAVFWKNISRCWPLWAAYLLIWLLLLPLEVFSRLRGSVGLEGITALDLREMTLQIASLAGPIMSLLFGVMAAMAVYSYLYSHRSASWFHALPIRREGLFFSNCLSGLCFLLVPNVLVFLVTLGVEAAYGVLDLVGLLSWLGAVSLSGIFFFSLATFCAQLTGHVLILPLLYIVLNFVVVGAEILARMLFRALAYGAAFSPTRFVLGWGSPFVKLMEQSPLRYVYQVDPADDALNRLTDVHLGQWPALLVYVVVGLVLLAGALLLYRHRRTESAGDVVAVPVLRPVFRYCMGIGAALSLGLLLCSVFQVDNGSPGMGLLLRMLPCLLFAAAVGYFAAEMLIKKSLRVFRRGLPGFLVCCLIVTAALVLIECDATGYERRMPEMQEVEYAHILVSGVSSYVSVEPEEIARVQQLHQTLVGDKQTLEQAQYEAASQPVRSSEETAYQISIEYGLKGGGYLCRAYWFPVTRQLLQDETSPAAQVQSLLNSREAVEGRYSFSEEGTTVIGGRLYLNEFTGVDYREVDLDQKQAQALYEAVQEDIDAGRLGQIDLLNNSVSYYGTDDAVTLDCRIILEGRYELQEKADEPGSAEIHSLSFSITLQAERTVAELEQLAGGPLNTVLENIELAESRLAA